MRWVLVLGLVALVACARGDNEVGSVGGRDTVGDGDLALPPSGGAPIPRAGGAAPDTVSAEDAAPYDTTETVGPGPPPRLDVGAIVNVYRRNYQELISEFGSEVRNDVDSKLVEDAKRMTALEHGFVDLGAWNDMVSELSPSQRAELAERIAATNRDLARELHTGPRLPSG
ncbi:MAG: hypothetical protein ABR527_03000 [Gemmatimonadota bacterium]